MKKYIFLIVTIALSSMAFMAFQQAKPTPKAPIYKEVQQYSPYYIDKRFGGLQLMSKEESTFKEKPSNMEVFHRLEFLEKAWAKKHLKMLDKALVISDNNGTEIARINIKTPKDEQFINSFYGIKK
jgi:hypothetical protein